MIMGIRLNQKNNMDHDILCENCKAPYKEKESAWKLSFKKSLGKEEYCDDCFAATYDEGETA